MRIDETATEIALAVTQYQDLYNGDFTGLFNAAQTVAGTTTVTGLFGTTIITGIVNTTATQTIAWQKLSPSGHLHQSVRRRQAVSSHCRTTTSCQEAER